MLLYTMLYIVLAYLMLFAALTNSVCLNNASFFFLFKYFLCQGYELSGEIALKNNHYYYYYSCARKADPLVTVGAVCVDSHGNGGLGGCRDGGGGWYLCVTEQRGLVACRKISEHLPSES